MHFNFHYYIIKPRAITIVIALNKMRNYILSNWLSFQSFTMTKLQFTYSKYKFFPWPFAFTKYTKMTTTTTNQLLQFRFSQRSYYLYNFTSSHFKIGSLQEIRGTCIADHESMEQWKIWKVLDMRTPTDNESIEQWKISLLQLF